MGKLSERDQVLEGLQAASGFLRGELGRRLQMRRAPEVVFQLDRGLERGTSVLGLLNRLEDERQQRGEIPPGSDQQPGSDEQPCRLNSLRRRVAELLVVRASGHLSDQQRRYPQWELPNSELQRLLGKVLVA